MSEQLLSELRAAKPAAPPALRERVRALAAQEPAPEPFLARLARLRPTRQALLVAAPATVALALAAGTVIGLTQGDLGLRGDEQAASGGGTATRGAIESAPADDSAKNAAPPIGGGTGLVAPDPGQLQRYQAELSLRVEDVDALSSATQRAQRIALRYGGSVASLQYDAAPGGSGSAQIALRVPTARVQSALAELSQLGTIIGQRFGIEDLQVQADTLQTQLEEVQREIADLNARLGRAGISDAERSVLQSRLASAREQRAALQESLRGTNAEGRTATVFLTLTTEDVQAIPVGNSRLDDVKDVLAWEGLVLLYLAVIAGPFILLGVLVWLALRLLRRREQTRLLAEN